MQFATSRLFSVLILLASVAPFVVSAQTEEQVSEILSLGWDLEPTAHNIEAVNASITTNAYEGVLVGQDASRFMTLMQGIASAPDAVVFRFDGPEAYSQVIFAHESVGYLKTDDWEEMINKDELLSEIRASTVEANLQRAQGYDAIFVDSWAQEPFLDRTENIIYWAIAGHDASQNQFVNAKALKLGREGYTEILWIGGPEQFTSAESVLGPILNNFNYKDGFTYQDFVPGKDTVAAAGAGALVYKLITGKAGAQVGAGLMVVLLAFAKKLWFLLFLPFIFGWQWLKGKFSRQ